MTTNGYISIKGEAYTAHIFIENKLTADDMGERYEREASVRVPIRPGEFIDINLGDLFSVEGDAWKVVGITVNRRGMSPHYHLKGVR